MKQKIVAAVVQGMLPYLNNAQTEKLQEVLLHTLGIMTLAFLMAKPRGKSKIFYHFFSPQSVLKVVLKSR